MPTLITRYVNVNSPMGGNGTTPATGSGDANRAYSGFLAALTSESASRTNLVSRDELLKLDCAGGVDAFPSSVLPSFTTDTTRYVWIYSAPENSHRGIWDTSKYAIVSAGNISVVINIDNIPNLQFEGIQIENRSTNGVWSIFGLSNAVLQDRTLDMHRCFLRSISGSGNAGSALNMQYIIRKSTQITNTIIQGAFGTAITIGYAQSGSRNSIMYNNTLYGCVSGTLLNNNETQAAFHLKNNIISSIGPSYTTASTSNITSSNNISSDDTSPNIQFRNMVPSFVSTISSSLNLQLSDNDTIAKDRGASLVNDSIYPFSTDIANNPRPQRFSSWDIGALENPNGKNKIVVSTAVMGKPFTISQTSVGRLIEGSQ